MEKKKKPVKYKASESFDKFINSQNDYWGLGESNCNKLSDGKSVEVNSKDSCVKYLIDNEHLVKG